jgi:hypothetical protein
MMRHTGSTAVGAISTNQFRGFRLRIRYCNSDDANCSPLGPISLTRHVYLAVNTRPFFLHKKTPLTGYAVRPSAALRMGARRKTESASGEIFAFAGPHGNCLRRHFRIADDHLMSSFCNYVREFIGYFLIPPSDSARRPAPLSKSST